MPPRVVKVLSVVCAALGVLAGALDWWASRYALNPDGVSYVEMAQHALVHGPGALVSGYWSPGYPALLAAGLAAVRGPLSVTIPAMHAINLLLYLLGLSVFVVLLRAGAPEGGDQHGFVGFAPAFGTLAFAVLALRTIGLWLLTPDFAVMAAVLATAIACHRLGRPGAGRADAAALGLVLGTGYWVKGILFPLNALLLLLLLVTPPRIERARRLVLLAGAVALVVALPLAVAVSVRVGRVTAGDVGRLNYAWLVNGAGPTIGWLGDATGRFGRPAHPPRVIASQPLTIEFATPIAATYALWYDPSYWNAGLRPRFDPAAEGRAIAANLLDLKDALWLTWIIPAVLALLWVMTARAPGAVDGRIGGVLVVWAALAIAVYALVHVEPRYLAGFFAVWVAEGWRALARREPRRGSAIAMLVSLGALVAGIVANFSGVGGVGPGHRPDYFTAAERLHQMGVPAGARVAAVGDAFEQYAAFAAGTPIAAQVVDSAGFWELSPAARGELVRRIAGTGARALLANQVPASAAGDGWRSVPGSDPSSIGVLLLWSGAPR